MVGEFAYLKVISVNRNIGAFLTWGLAKDLLLPFREQESPVRAGDWVIGRVCKACCCANNEAGCDPRAGNGQGVS
jgi:hypothetical protein